MEPRHPVSDPRQDLLRQMMALRRSLDPKLLERAKLAVFGKVPYDRENARAAVGAFLEERNDGGAFKRRLEAALRREGAALDLAEAPPDATAKPAGEPLPDRPRRPGRLT